MERISIFNYEIFYLDYLEGKLEENDVAMLMQFFEEHPECVLENDDLPTLSDDSTTVYKGKASLKQVEDSEAITTTNVEHFMISNAEGLLSNEKSEELSEFVEGDVNLEKDNKRYNAVYFEADSEIVFQNKEDLKRKKVFVLWPYVSGAIAAAVISFVFLMNGGTSTVTGDVETDSFAFMPEFVTPKLQDQVSPNKSPIVFEDVPVKNQIATYEKPQRSNKTEKRPIEKFESLAFRRAHNMESSFDKKIEPMTLDYNPPLPTDLHNNNEGPITVDNRMQYPIKPVTNFIGEKTNKNIEFGRKKATKTKKGGFVIKIGKFELSRNKNEKAKKVKD